MTATDSSATLRQVLSELRALRIRIDRQIALVQSALRPASGKARRPRRRPKTTPKPSVRVGKRAAKTRPTGYVKERQALETRKKKKKTRR